MVTCVVSVGKLKLGFVATATKTITDDDVRNFADLVGDHNPIHLDESFAQKTKFGRRIVHGLLTGSLISAAIGNHFYGVYLSQTLQFVAPVYPGDTITARATVTKIRDDRPVITLETICLNQLGKTVIRGEANVLIEKCVFANNGG
jgi:3-hydroxybutyryl-CoA dehydratase